MPFACHPFSLPKQLIGCSREAMQGLPDFIPTATKTAYLNQLLRVGFAALDFGSFVSARAIPQLRDTAAVPAGLDTGNSPTEHLVAYLQAQGEARDLDMPAFREAQVAAQQVF